MLQDQELVPELAAHASNILGAVLHLISIPDEGDCVEEDYEDVPIHSGAHTLVQLISILCQIPTCEYLTPPPTSVRANAPSQRVARAAGFFSQVVGDLVGFWSEFLAAKPPIKIADAKRRNDEESPEYFRTVSICSLIRTLLDHYQ